MTHQSCEYKSEIENGIKSALSTLNEVWTDNYLIDSKVRSVIISLQNLVVEAQLGRIYYIEVEQ